jgi:death-on-curing protein
MKPQMAAYYEGADIVRQAALLGVGISQAQAFLDGNKRTAYLTLNTFLRMNGLTYSGDRLALARQFEQFAERSSEPDAAIDAFEAWLRQYVQPRPEPT